MDIDFLVIAGITFLTVYGVVITISLAMIAGRPTPKPQPSRAQYAADYARTP